MHTPEPASKHPCKASLAKCLNVGAGLPAMALYRPKFAVADTLLSRTSPLPPWFSMIQDRAFRSGEYVSLRCFFQQQSRGREALPILLGQVARPGDKIVQAVLVDKLQRAAAPRGKANAED